MKKNQNGFSAVEALLILLVIGMIGFTGWYVWHAKQGANMTYSKANGPTATKTLQTKKSAEQQAFVLPKNWTWDEQSDQGYKFAYPSSWATPKITVSSGETGKDYRISFYPGPAYTPQSSSYPIPSRNQIIVGFDSDDYAFNACNDSGHCSLGGPYTSASRIEQILTSIKDGTAKSRYSMNVVYHDNTSFATVSTGSEIGSTDTLEVQRTVSLPKLNTSAVFGQYFILDAQTDCNQNALSTVDKAWCMNQDILQTMNNVLKSFSSIK